MKFLCLIFLLVNSINSARSHSSSAEILRGCQLVEGNELVCQNFHHKHVPYAEEFEGATRIRIIGYFSELTINSAYDFYSIYISSPALEKFEVDKYTNFGNLSEIKVHGSENVLKVSFTGADKFVYDHAFIHLTLRITGNKGVSFSCENLKSSNLKSLDLWDNNMEQFDFSCVPNAMRHLILMKNNLSTTNPHCSDIKNLHSLQQLDLSSNSLNDFSFQCLPDSIETVNLADNDITEVTDLADVPYASVMGSYRIAVDVRHNPIRCTCSLLRDFVELLDSKKVTFSTSHYQAITCSNDDSKLAAYPWNNNKNAIKLHDNLSLGCLTGGEDDGNSASVNFIPISLIVVSHILQLYFILL